MAVTEAKREKPFRITINTIEDKMLYDIKEFNVEPASRLFSRKIRISRRTTCSLSSRARATR